MLFSTGSRNYRCMIFRSRLRGKCSRYMLFAVWQDVVDDEYEEEQELADEFDSDFNDEVIAVTLTIFSIGSFLTCTIGLKSTLGIDSVIAGSRAQRTNLSHSFMEGIAFSLNLGDGLSSHRLGFSRRKLNPMMERLRRKKGCSISFCTGYYWLLRVTC